jgi:outer membrane protein assembly factor BamB
VISRSRSNPIPFLPVLFILCQACSICLGADVPDTDPHEVARYLLADAGVEGGLVVHAGCGEAKLTAALKASDGYVVEGLDTDDGNVAKARRHLESLGVCGKVTVESFDGKHLPYADNLVNLLVVSNTCRVPREEALRVLAPRSMAYVQEGDRWRKTVKPWPDDIDDWSHFLHDATGNAVAHDRVVAAPRRLQWIGGPLWSRSHEYDASLCAMVSSGGRLFYIFDEGPTGIIDKRVPDKWTLTARDAFNGIVLWKREVPDWGWKAWKRAELKQTDWSRMGSQRFRLPVAIPRRLVAAGDRVYVTLGYRAPVTALDAATGRTITTYESTGRTDEIVHQDGTLVLCIRSAMEGRELPANKRGRRDRQPGAAQLVALEADTGRRLWQTEPGAVIPLSLAFNGRHVFYHDPDAVVCLDAASGQQKWRTPTGGAGNSTWNTDTTLVVHNDVVLCAKGKQILGLSVADGKTLWKLPGARGFGIGNPPDLFVADGLVWYGRGGAEPQSITGYDPHTGKPARTVNVGPVITHGHHARCYRSKATDNYLLLPKRAVEFIDIQAGRHSRHNWVRGACRYGVLPCNGLLYSTPHPCFCYAGVKLGGFLALAPQEVAMPREDTPRLAQGPAYESPLKTEAGAGDSGANDWTMYRHDPKRTGATPSEVGTDVSSLWQTKLGGKLTQPVVAGKSVFVARADAGQICCLDAATGKPVWDHVAGGRIDSSPTYHRGRLIFGSADGWVYCLRASDGAMAWRFRAAPGRRRVMAFGQIESAWPVHGSVLVTGGVAYFTAGRSSFLDGGIVLYGIDPVRGEKLYETRIDGPQPNTDVLDEMAYSMEGAKSDILVTDGDLIYLFHNAFDKRLRKQPTPVKDAPGVRNLGERDFGKHLFSNAGFLDTSGFNRSYWMVNDRWPAFNFAHQSPKAGQLVVFDDAVTYAAKCFVRRNMLSPQAFPGTDGYYLVADGNDTRPVLVKSDGKAGPEFMRWLPQDGELQTCWNLGVGFARSKPAKWINVLPVRIRAMVRTGNALFVAGPPDVCEADDPAAALEGRAGAVLMAFDPADGSEQFQCKLDAPPVFDGMAAARGGLYISLRDGTVMCLKETD